MSNPLRPLLTHVGRGRERRSGAYPNLKGLRWLVRDIMLGGPSLKAGQDQASSLKACEFSGELVGGPGVRARCMFACVGGRGGWTTLLGLTAALANP